MASTVAIQTQGLTRTYRSYKKAEGLWNSLKGLVHREHIDKLALAPTNLEIYQGQVVGLVGANGAGKTTLLKLLSGLIHPSAGEAKVLGYTPWQRPASFLKRISILLGQKNQLWWDIPAADSFELLARIYEIDLVEAKKRALHLAEILSCQDMLHVQLRRLSLGERMKMELIGALLHQPEVLFLDEPTIGLDIVAQSNIRSFLIDYVKQHKPTILLTSHYMDDISTLADRLMLISQGQLVYDGTIEGFVGRAEPLQKISFRLERPLDTDLKLTDEIKIAAGLEIVEVEVPNSQVGHLLGAILKVRKFQNLKIEEADFEDVIHRFLAKDARYRPPGRSISV